MNKFVIQYLSDYSKIPVEEITMDTRLDLDLNLNSLDFVIMICDIESKYNIHIEDEEFKSCYTIEDLTKIVKQYI